MSSIAVLAWGSLIHQLHSPLYETTLEIEGNFVQADDLRMPVSLSRWSTKNTLNERFTLVIDPTATDKVVYYAVMKMKTLAGALENLRQRKRTPNPKAICYLKEGVACEGEKQMKLPDTVIWSGQKGELPDAKAREVALWGRKHHFTAIIWTGLPSNIDPSLGETGAQERDIVPHLRANPRLLANTKAYILNLPAFAITPFMERVVKDDIAPSPVVDRTIAVLAFGSLIQQLHSPVYKATLEIEGNFAPAEGLELPVSLSRWSSKDLENERLTMTIDPYGPEKTAFFATSVFKKLAEAMENLRQREGRPALRHICYLKSGSPSADEMAINLSDAVWSGKKGDLPGSKAQEVAQWGSLHHFTAVIWTGIPSNIDVIPGRQERAIFPLLRSNPRLFTNTKGYINNLPSHCITPLMERILAGELDDAAV